MTRFEYLKQIKDTWVYPKRTLYCPSKEKALSRLEEIKGELKFIKRFLQLYLTLSNWDVTFVVGYANRTEIAINDTEVYLYLCNEGLQKDKSFEDNIKDYIIAVQERLIKQQEYINNMDKEVEVR